MTRPARNSVYADRPQRRLYPGGRRSPLAGILLLLAAARLLASDLEVFEVAADRTSELPRGKEADGIIGDFVLRNDAVEALVSGDLPRRKANMSVHYHAVTPGCLYDLSVRGSDNDQLTYFAPAALEGDVSSVRIAEYEPGLPGVLVERTAAAGGGHALSHHYFLRPGSRYLAIASRYANHGPKDWKLAPAAAWKELRRVKTVEGIQAGDAMNPPDQQGYATYTVALEPGGARDGLERLPAAPKEVVLKPGEERQFATFVAPARSPLEAWGILAALRGPAGALRARLHEGERPLPSAALRLHLDSKRFLDGYPDPEGRLEVSLPPGTYRVVASEIGRSDVEKSVEVTAGEVTALDLAMEPASGLVFEVTACRSDPRKSPCKVQFIGLRATKDPVLGSDINAHGCRNQYHSENGHFTQQLPPGDYRLIITHGVEFDHVVEDVSLEPGEMRLVRACLERIVDTRGWISADFHNHSTPSGDNYCGTDDRVINLAVENIEFAPTTEHNRLYDWGPHIRRLGLSQELSTVPGIELTGSGPHLNAFPLEVQKFAQDGGAPVWHRDPRVNAIVLRDFQGGGPHRWVHLNHPSVGEYFRDRDGDGAPDGGFEGLEDLIDAAETWSLEILRKEPWYERSSGSKKTWRENRTFAWLQLLNQGTRLWCIAVADAHSVVGNGVGGWRTYIQSSTDEPARIDPVEVIRNAKAGKMFVTNGPFLEVELDDGTGPGGSTIARGKVTVDVRIQSTDWVAVDRVQVLVNSRQPEELDFRRTTHPELFRQGAVKFHHKVPVVLTEDSHIIVAALGEGSDLSRGWGKTWEAAMHPCAFTNPIYVDVDGKGWRANGDTLGYPLPAAKNPLAPPPEPASD